MGAFRGQFWKHVSLHFCVDFWGASKSHAGRARSRREPPESPKLRVSSLGYAAPETAGNPSGEPGEPGDTQPKDPHGFPGALRETQREHLQQQGP